jgi:hypothetical protein
MAWRFFLQIIRFKKTLYKNNQKAMNMTFSTFEQEFVPFCETPGIKSGKAKSYYRAIKYLAEYLHMNAINNENAQIILSKENEVHDKASNFYIQLLNWLIPQRRGSYLADGYISAALPLFREFAMQHGLI